MLHVIKESAMFCQFTMTFTANTIHLHTLAVTLVHIYMTRSNTDDNSSFFSSGTLSSSLLATQLNHALFWHHGIQSRRCL